MEKKSNSLFSVEGMRSLFWLISIIVFFLLISIEGHAYDKSTICVILNITDGIDCNSFWNDINKSNSTILINQTFNSTINITVNQTVYIDNSSKIIINDTNTITNNIYNNDIINNKTETIIYLNHTEVYNNTNNIGNSNFSIGSCLADSNCNNILTGHIVSIVQSKLDEKKPSPFADKLKGLGRYWWAFLILIAYVFINKQKIIEMAKKPEKPVYYQPPQSYQAPPGYVFVPSQYPQPVQVQQPAPEMPAQHFDPKRLQVPKLVPSDAQESPNPYKAVQRP